MRVRLVLFYFRNLGHNKRGGCRPLERCIREKPEKRGWKGRKEEVKGCTSSPRLSFRVIRLSGNPFSLPHSLSLPLFEPSKVRGSEKKPRFAVKIHPTFDRSRRSIFQRAVTSVTSFKTCKQKFITNIQVCTVYKDKQSSGSIVLFSSSRCIIRPS